MQRLVTAVVLIVVVLAALLMAPSLLFEILLMAFASVVVFELCGMLKEMDLSPWPPVAVAGTVATIGVMMAPSLSLGPVWVGLVFVSALCVVCSGVEPAVSARRFAGTLVAVAYVGPLMGYVGLLHSGSAPGPVVGSHPLLFTLFVTYIADSFAYYGGSTFGRHKLSPRISPNKTVEGALFAGLGGVLAALVMRTWLLPEISLGHAIAIGAIVTLAGILGDLAESALKRASGVKDSGRCLPGHGGLFDRVDSLLFAAPALYWYCRLVLE